jgi:hypothetical protein
MAWGRPTDVALAMWTLDRETAMAIRLIPDGLMTLRFTPDHEARDVLFTSEVRNENVRDVKAGIWLFIQDQAGHGREIGCLRVRLTELQASTDANGLRIADRTWWAMDRIFAEFGLEVGG